MHDFLTVGAPAPLQAAGAVGMAFDADYYNHLVAGLPRAARPAVRRAHGGRLHDRRRPQGAYYVLAGYGAVRDEPDDVAFARWLASEVGVATVPASSFYRKRGDGRGQVRFAFCKRTETLQAAADRLVGMRAAV